MTISVVIPAFNASAWIREAIDSVTAQTFQDLEIVVVDDGSTDETGELVQSIKEPRLRLIRQTNSGQSAALNKGAESARGQFIKFMDADDWLNPSHLEAQLRALDGTSNQLASCRWGYFANDPATVEGRVESTNYDYSDPLEWLVDSLTHEEGMMGGWTWLIPRAVFDRSGGWDERLSLNNDFHFSIRLLLASDGVRFAPDAIYAYRKGLSGALSGSRGRKAMDSAWLTTELGCNALLQRENSPRIRRICADRFQDWLFQFYPDFPDLALKAEQRVKELGGSQRQINGGTALKLMLPIFGWKRVRSFQSFAYRAGWSAMLRLKARKRAARFR